MWNHCSGRTFGMATSERKEIIREKEEYQNMPVYPYDGSVAVICDTIVIKLSEE
jgi:hypothetical protein